MSDSGGTRRAVVRYREVRHFRRGAGTLFYASGGIVIIIGATVAPIDTLPRVAFWSVGIVMASVLALRFETTVEGGLLTLEVRPLWRRRIELEDVVSTEVVLADFQVAWFGGWNARGSAASALITDIEGDRSFGRTAVRVHLRSGRFCQVGSFHPTALVAAIEAERPRSGGSVGSG